MDKVQELLDDTMVRELQEMYLQNPDEDGYEKRTDRVTKLYKLRIEDKQADNEKSAKDAQLAEAKKTRWINFAVSGAGIVLPLVFYGVWMRRGFRFEETGTYTSKTFMNLFGKIKPTK